MSYTIPGQNGGFVRTDAPSPPCTGNFVERLDCSDYGFFFWVGAVCVIVVVCGLFSCYIVSPFLEWWKEKRDDTVRWIRSRHPVPPDHHHHQQHADLDKARLGANAENIPGRTLHRAKEISRKHRCPHSIRVLAMTSDEEKELEASGAFASTVRTKRQRSAQSSRDANASLG